jgi:pimeloyl-ACP methyl ester carboxylesterase
MVEQEVALEVRGKTVQLWQGGDGPPLLYLHGAGLYIWMPVHNWLAGRRRVFLPVHPGFGESGGFDEIEDIEDLVFHTVDVMDELGLEQADVVGLSLGGWLAAELALRHPHRVKRLVLVDAAGTRVAGVPRGNIFMATPAKARALLFHDPASRLATTLVPDAVPSERMETVLRGREAAARLLWHPHVAQRKLTSRLGRITAPTLVVWGSDDKLLPLAYGEAYANGIPGARLVVIEKSGHLPPFEHPERFADVVLSFLEA